MLERAIVWKGGLAAVAAFAMLTAPEAASAQTYSRGCGSYNAPVTYVGYQPTQYAPVYTDRQVVYTAPPRVRYVEPVREVVRYVPQPISTRTVYVRPRYDHYPRTVVYSSGSRHGHRSDYGYGSGYRGSHYGARHFGRHNRHRASGFHLDVGGVHIGARRGHHGGYAVRVRH